MTDSQAVSLARQPHRAHLGAAEEVPGSATLNRGGDATVASLSCGSMGDCSAGGASKDSSGNHQASVVTKTAGG